METVDDLKKKFEHFVIEESVAVNDGNDKKGNYYNKKIKKLYYQVKALGLTDIFFEYLDHKDENLQIWAAGFCLRKYPQQSKKVLKKLSHSSDLMIRISAKATLEFVEKGQWDKLIE